MERTTGFEPATPTLARWLRHARYRRSHTETPAQGPHGYQSVSGRANPLAARLRHVCGVDEEGGVRIG